MMLISLLTTIILLFISFGYSYTLKHDHVVSRDLQPWISEEILSVKREKQKSEQIWKKIKLIVHLEIFRALCLNLKTLIHDAKKKCFHKKISDCGGDQNKLFRIVNFSTRTWKTGGITEAYRLFIHCFSI